MSNGATHGKYHEYPGYIDHLTMLNICPHLPVHNTSTCHVDLVKYFTATCNMCNILIITLAITLLLLIIIMYQYYPCYQPSSACSWNNHVHNIYYRYIGYCVQYLQCISCIAHRTLQHAVIISIYKCTCKLLHSMVNSSWQDS